MTSGDDSPAARLRRAGYEKLPRWWVTRDQLEVIERMARGNLPEVRRIKGDHEGADDWGDYGREWPGA